VLKAKRVVRPVTKKKVQPKATQETAEAKKKGKKEKKEKKYDAGAKQQQKATKNFKSGGR